MSSLPICLTFVDIGCAEGHYVAGVARRRPEVEVVAFDVDPAARQMCRIIARANRAEVQVRASATTEYLSTLASGTVVFSDCEGTEGELLDPSRAPEPTGIDYLGLIQKRREQELWQRIDYRHLPAADNDENDNDENDSKEMTG